MRSSGRRISRAITNTTTTKKDDGAGTKAALAGGAAGLMTDVANPTVTSCASDDSTFYCKLTRFFNSTKMIINLIITLIVIIALVYFGWKWWKQSQKGGMHIGAVKVK